MQLDLEQLRTLKAVVEHGHARRGRGRAARHAVGGQPAPEGARERDRRPGAARAQPSPRGRPRPARRCCGSPARSSCSPPTRAAELAGDAAPPRLGVAVNADSMATWFLPAIAPLAGEVAVECHREDEDQHGAAAQERPVVAAITVYPDAGRGLHRRRGSARCATGRWPRRPSRRAGSPTARRREALAARADDGLRPRRLAPARLPAAARARRDPPQTMVPSSTDFVRAIGLGLGWGMVADLQRPDGAGARRARAGRGARRRSCTSSAGACARRASTASPRRSSPAPASG